MSSAPIRLDVIASVDLWLLRLAATLVDGDMAMLDDSERARAARFAFDRDRARFVSAHAGLRRLLADRTGVPAPALRFELGRFGKPRLQHAPRCSFSLSHSGDHALVALADDEEIGVDLEAVHALPDVQALSARCLGPRERFAFAATPEAERELAFLRAWTRKEACLKALGTGLQIEPAAIEVGLDPAERLLQVASPGGSCELVVTSFEPAAGWLAAVARLGARPKGGIPDDRPRL